MSKSIYGISQIVTSNETNGISDDIAIFDSASNQIVAMAGSDLIEGLANGVNMSDISGYDTGEGTFTLQDYLGVESRLSYSGFRFSHSDTTGSIDISNGVIYAKKTPDAEIQSYGVNGDTLNLLECDIDDDIKHIFVDFDVTSEPYNIGLRRYTVDYEAQNTLYRLGYVYTDMSNDEMCYFRNDGRCNDNNPLANYSNVVSDGTNDLKRTSGMEFTSISGVEYSHTDGKINFRTNDYHLPDTTNETLEFTITAINSETQFDATGFPKQEYWDGRDPLLHFDITYVGDTLDDSSIMTSSTDNELTYNTTYSEVNIREAILRTDITFSSGTVRIFPTTAYHMDYEPFDKNTLGTQYSDAFTKTVSRTLNTTQYNNLYTGLSDLTTGAYGIHWIYTTPQNSQIVVWGQEEYATLADARAVTRPTYYPSKLKNYAVECARSIFLKGATTTEIKHLYDDDAEIYGTQTVNNLIASTATITDLTVTDLNVDTLDMTDTTGSIIQFQDGMTEALTMRDSNSNKYITIDTFNDTVIFSENMSLQTNNIESVDEIEITDCKISGSCSVDGSLSCERFRPGSESITSDSVLDTTVTTHFITPSATTNITLDASSGSKQWHRIVRKNVHGGYDIIINCDNCTINGLSTLTLDQDYQCLEFINTDTFGGYFITNKYP